MLGMGTSDGWTFFRCVHGSNKAERARHTGLRKPEDFDVPEALEQVRKEGARLEGVVAPERVPRSLAHLVK